MTTASIVTTPSLNASDLRRRIRGAWQGKAIGGTLGMPYEGVDGPLSLSFYDPVPKQMVPNDDLDLQVVWACALARMESPRVDRHVLAQAWLDHVQFPFDEYGYALRNLRHGVSPPLSGSFDNWFVNGMGAAIRSELWACLAAGKPEVAAAYAYEDGCVDHACEGLAAEQFLAAMQSAAFVESDLDRLLEIGLDVLSEQSLLRRAVEDTCHWWRRRRDWLQVRQHILDRYGSDNVTDVMMNIAFTVLGWLAGEGDFSRSICITANCGKDTDSTAATAGALLGIIDPDSIGKDWLEPIGENLFLSPEIVGINAPSTLDDLTELVLDLRRRLPGTLPEATTPEQDTASLAVPIELGFIAWSEAFNRWRKNQEAPPMPANAERVNLPGTFATLTRENFQNSAAILRYRFRLAETLPVRVMLNASTHVLVWLDGKYAFGRESGPMLPSLHRPSINQYIDLNLKAGEHEIWCALRRPSDEEQTEWVVGVGDARTTQWLTYIWNAEC